MPLFEIRMTCGYALQIEAESEEEAIEEAMKVDLEDWDQVWSEMDVEKIA